MYNIYYNTSFIVSTVRLVLLVPYCIVQQNLSSYLTAFNGDCSSSAGESNVKSVSCGEHQRSVLRQDLLSRRSRQRERLVHRCCSSVRLLVCLSVHRQNAKKRDFLKKLSNLQLWSLLTTYRKSYMGFSKYPLRDP